MKRIITFLMIIFLSLNFSAFSAEEKYVTRIEFITYVMSSVGVINSEKEAGFSDLSPDDKYYNYVAAAKEHGVVTGYSDNTLRPYENISRQEAIVILSRAYQLKPVSGIYISGFSDFKEIGQYSVGYVSAAARNGIIEYQTGAECKPKGYITIDEMYLLTGNFKDYITDTLHFAFGYPKEAKEKVYNAISVTVKASRPCTVYYKLLPSEKYLSSFKPKVSEITEFLTSVNIADVTIDVNIYPKDYQEYNLYIVAVDADGNYTDVECISEVAAHRFTVGKGTENEPYLIYSEEQLKGIKYYPKAYFRLENDIEISGDWKPITIDSKGYIGFSGVFDGNFCKITGFEVKSYEDNIGLFSSIYGGTVKNLYADGVVRGDDNVGIIAGLSEGGNIIQCFVSGRVYASGNNAGGIVGSNNGAVKDCISAAYMVESSNYAGGISGANRGDIINCLSAAYSVSADMYASGVAGVNIGGRVNKNVAANLYADDIITTRTGRITTNKQYGTTLGNYCYDKMMSNSSVDFNYESHDGLEASWEELTNPEFYSKNMGWDTKNVWNNFVSEDFRLLSLKGFESIDMIKGITMYAPVKIYTEEDLLEVSQNTDYHYILMNDIVISDDTEWKMIGDGKSEESGFNGTFDGNNHTISGLHIVQKDEEEIYGMFGVISAGTVRNLKLINVAFEGHSLVGGLAGENYGYIENCSVNGRIYALRKSNMLSVGGITGNNYGIIENVSANVKIRALGQVLTVGGIAANNDGFIDMADFKGNIEAEQKTANSNAVAGGIVGINTSGYIYNSHTDIDIDSRASVSYIGGISGIMNGGEIYKTSSEGRMFVSASKENDSSAYVGGTAGLTPAGLVMNSFSGADIFIEANNVYAGGIVGYNQTASIQNTYSINMIDVVSGIFNDALGYTAGICGFSEEGFISDSVALNKSIETNGYADEICNIQTEMVSCVNNYMRSDMEIYGEENNLSSGGIGVDINEVKTPEFFFLPVAEGGKLGWIKEDVWYISSNYFYPLLYGVKQQEIFKN